MQISNKNSKEGVAAQIASFEEKYGIRLPDDYKSFLVKYNGGDTPETSFFLGKGKGLGETDVRCFYSVAEEQNSFRQMEGVLVFKELIEKGLLPVANDTYGNEFVIGVTGEGAGKVLYYNHERQQTTAEVAESFRDFVQKCKTEIKRGVRTFEVRAASYREKHGGQDAPEDLKALWRKQVKEAEVLYSDMTIVEF